LRGVSRVRAEGVGITAATIMTPMIQHVLEFVKKKRDRLYFFIDKADNM